MPVAHVIRAVVFAAALLLWPVQAAPLRAQAPLAFTARDLMATIETLSSAPFEGRRAGSPGNLLARKWIVERFRDAGLRPLTADFLMPFTFTEGASSVDGSNIVGVCRGSGTDTGALVISAHYDHLGMKGAVLFPGADDNASGVAVLLALARQCRVSPWTHDAVFVAFDAEERALQGARAFVAAPPIDRQRIRLNINLDMVSRSATRELYTAGAAYWPALRSLLEPVAKRARIKLMFGHDQAKPSAGPMYDWTMQSDHGVFHKAGIPFVYFGVEDHADYHQPTDTPDRIDPTFLDQVATTILDAVTVLDRSLPAPRP